jgi:DNA-binding winged helix-turn-helix (wHTH) protein/tetratricopeptide (TPR) repeat protein/TolB-like protein
VESPSPATSVTTPPVLRFGPYALDTGARRLTIGGETIPLSPKAYEVLQLLVSNAGRALSREEILKAVWQDTVVEPGSLDWHVSALRRTMPEARGAIETLRGFGYRFSWSPAATLPDGAVSPEDAEAAEPAEPAPPTIPAKARGGRSLWFVVSGLLVIAALAWISSRRAERRPPAHAPTVAVLAFENLSGDERLGWLSVALRELLAAEISQSVNVTMVPGETTARAVTDLRLRAGAPSAETLATLRQTLGTDVVISGGYVVAGKDKKLRVVSTVQDCVSAQTLETVEQTGTVEDVLTLVTQIGARLRSPFEARAPSLEARQTRIGFGAGADALRLYMEGLGRLRELRTLEARDLLVRATELDRSFALAHSALAEAWSQLGYEKAALEEAELAVARSSGLSREDKALVEGRHAELAGRWERAIEVYQALDTLYPESVDDGLKLANALTHGKRAPDARRVLDRLARLPGPKGEDPRIDIARAWAARWLGDFPAMDAAARAVERKGRARSLPHLTAQALFLRSWVAVTVSRGEDADVLSAEGARLAREIGDVGLAAQHLALRGYGLYQLGRLADARATFEDGLAAARSIGYTESARGILSGLSQLELADGRIEPAERYAKEGLETARAVGDETEVTALTDLSRVALAKGDLPRATALAKEALEKARRVAISSRIREAQYDLGAALFLAGDLAGARAAFSETLRFAAGTVGTEMADIRLRLARVEIAERRPAEAVDGARRAIAEAVPATIITCQAHETLAEALAAARAPGVREELAAAAELAAKLGGAGDRLDLALAKGRALERTGAIEAAREAFTSASALAAERGFLPASLEARLHLASFDARAHVAGASARVAALESEARARGWGLLASR